MVLRFRITDEADQHWFDQRRKAGRWRVTCYGKVPTTAGFVW
jgi:hypothetical protein